MYRVPLLALSLSALTLTSLPARPDEALRVELVEVTTRSYGLDVELTGTLEPLDSVDIGFRQAGRIIEVTVTEGDSFARGDVLARIDPLQLQQSQNASTAALASAQANEDQARQAAERAQAMLDRGVGTRAARDTARQVLSEAETATKQAQSALDQARRSVEDTTLLAPFDGVVTARMGEPGQVVGAAQVVLSLAARGGIEAVFLTPDMPRMNAALGKEMELRVLDIESPPMTGRITEISPLVDATTGSVRVRAEVDGEPEDSNLFGASVRGKLMLSVGVASEVPWTALTSTGGKPAVWVVEGDGTAQLREVQVVRFDTGIVLLSGGVDAGETVVGAGSQLLYPGRRVVGAGGAS